MLTKLLDIERLTHSIKTVIACLIGLTLTKFISFSSDLWVVVTIIVVMCAQIYVGSVVRKSYFRFLGTLLGCVFAILTLLILGTSNFAIATAISLSSFIFSYLAIGSELLTYAGTLGAVTTAIIMLSAQPTVLLASERFLQISVGILIASLVSQFVLPIHARKHLRKIQLTTLEQLRDYYVAAMVAKKMPDEKLTYDEIDERIIKLISQQRQLAKETAGEPFARPFNPKLVMQTLYCEREMFRTIYFMHIALINIKNERFIQSESLHHFNDVFLASLNTLINWVQLKDTTHSHIHLPDIKQFQKEICDHAELIKKEDVIYLDGLLFLAEMLIKSLKGLANIYRVPVHEVEQISVNTS